MQLFVPEIGSKLVLEENWTFILYSEYRNQKFFEKLDLEYSPSYMNNKQYNVTIPKGTILTVDRIYIRKGGSDYSSLTFRIVKGECPDKKFWSGRFWAKLVDVNKIKFEFLKGNEEVTKSLLMMLDEIRRKVSNQGIYHDFEKIILNKKTVNNFVIQEDEESYNYFSDVMERIRNSKHSSKGDVEKIANKFFRKYKIDKFLKDNA